MSIMKTVCEHNKCVGCHACEDLCPRKAIRIVDSMDAMNAEIDESVCVNCGICEKVCQVNHPVEKKTQIRWLQGWSTNEEIRAASSSGGLAAELSRSFIRSGGLVCSCKFSHGEFRFEFADRVEQLPGFAGSKYVKSTPQGVYKPIRNYLAEGKKILFIGLPCQCAAVKKATENGNNGGLYTVDLICHGSPSPKVLEAFLAQYHLDLNDINTISFRKSGQQAPQSELRPLVMPDTMDCYTIAFLNGLTYTENCYECQYANSQRVSDLTIGDSWGSTLQGGEKGISLALCNTEKGEQLLQNADLYLTDVDIARAIASNPQLREAAALPEKRRAFFANLKRGGKFNRLVQKCCFKQCFRQFVKRQMIRVGLKKLCRSAAFSVCYTRKH